MSKYQHIIDEISPKECEIVTPPKSDWREKVYPPPSLWISKKTLKKKRKYVKKETKQVEKLWIVTGKQR